MMLLQSVEAYLSQTGMSPTRFGREVANDPRLVWDMRKGRTAGARLEARILARIGEEAR